MKVHFKKLNPLAVTPSRAHETDAGFDLTAITRAYDGTNCCEIYGTGIAVEIPIGYFGAIFPRSSIYKTTMILSNCVGVIDCGFRGEIQFRFREANENRDASPYRLGDRIGQLVILPIPKIELVEADELSRSDRGEKGFGSTGA